MKKVLLGLVAVMMLVTPAMAAKKSGSKGSSKAEKRFGLGMDIVGGNQQLRISIDGITPGVRVDVRFAYASTPAASGLGLGVAGYYDLSKFISVGGHFDTEDTNLGGATRIAAVLKAEREIFKDFAIGIEFGYQNVSVTAGSTLGKYSAVTARIFF